VENDPMRHARLVILSLLVASLGPATVHAQPQRRGLPAPEQFVLPATAVEVPMHRFDRLPVVEVSINGGGPFRLVLDTGASGLLLRSDHAEGLDLPSPPGMPAGGVKTKVRTPGGPVDATLAYVDELTMGDVRIGGIWTLCTELPFGDSMDGVIGMALFRSCLLTYDYPGGRVVVSEGELPSVNGSDVFSYRTPGNSGSHPSIDLTVNGEPVEFLIDTGLRGWFSVPAGWAEEIGISAGPVEGPAGLSVGGAVRQQIARLASPISLGRYTVTQPVVRTHAEGGPSPLATRKVLGTYFLEHFVVTIDGPNERIRLADGPDGPITPPAVRSLGVDLKQTGREMEVWSVHPGSHAEAIGLEVGDRIRTIDGRPAVQTYRSPEWRELLRTKDTVTLGYAPGGSAPVREVEVRVLELLAGAA
jgi:predicted aspartyl protease